MNRPFTVLGVQQIAIGGDSLDALRSLWVDTLGVTKTGEYESASENVREDCLLYTSPSPRDATLSRMPSSA